MELETGVVFGGGFVVPLTEIKHGLDQGVFNKVGRRAICCVFAQQISETNFGTCLLQ